MKVPLNDLRREMAELRPSLEVALARVLDRGWFLMGEELSAFEQSFASYLGIEHCVAVANGTEAIELGLRCIGIDAGDRVIVAANAGMYGTIAVSRVGGEPVFAEVDDNSLCISSETLERAAATSRSKAVIVTHLYGQMTDMPALLACAASYGLRVIEDCAQAHGARLYGRHAGTFGDIACFSFYPTKNLGALGDAGAIITRSSVLADTARLLRQYGWRAGKYRVELPYGRNSRMDELQAAFLLAKLPELERRNIRRKAIWQHYRDVLDGRLKLVGGPGADFVAHLCVARSPTRDTLRQRLAEHGVTTDIHYPIPDHRQPVWGGRFANLSLPLTELACREVLTLPCFPEMTDTEVTYVTESLQRSL